MTYDFSNFSIYPQTGAVQFTASPDAMPLQLRLCTDRGATKFIAGTTSDYKFYDAAAIIAGLTNLADAWGSPLPEPVETPPAFEEGTAQEKLILVNAAFGADRDTLARQAGSNPMLRVVMDKARSLGLVIGNASDAGPLTDAIRAEAAEVAAARARGQQLENHVQDTMDTIKANVPPEEPLELMKIYKASPMELARAERLHPENRAQTMRTVWPFKDMEVGDKVRLPAVLAKKAQTAAHVYGSRAGKRFISTTERGTGILTVTRIGDRTARGFR